MILKWCKIYAGVGKNGMGIISRRAFSTATDSKKVMNEIQLLGQKFVTDEWTNVTPQIISKLERKLHITPFHPLSHIRERIINFIYSRFHNRIGNPIFSIYDNVCPIVSVAQNFDSLLVPKNHVSRQKSDCYYINQDTLLRAHTTAHQSEFISMGLNNFLIFGDVYRRDEIDRTHYPVFHQADAVRLCTREEVFESVDNSDSLKLFDNRGSETNDKQGCHTLESVKIMEHELKDSLTGLAQTIFGPDVQCRWVEQYFPFTHPSWELEVYHDDKWIEILGCGIMRQEILQNSGAGERIGWAFGLGLERLAMCLYNIPDIRLFWSEDTSFLNQFRTTDPNENISYKPISIYPRCKSDISFWLPTDRSYSSKDFYDIVKSIGGEIIEEITLIDEYHDPKSKRSSHCYTIVYRHLERTLRKTETNEVHAKIREEITEKLNVTVR